MRVRLREVPAAAGRQWIGQAFRTFRRRPGVFLMTFAAMVFGETLLTSLGVVGLVLFGLSVPMASLVFMMLTAWTLADQPEDRRLAAQPFAATRRQRQGLVGLCAVYFTAVIVLSWLGAAVAGDSSDTYVQAVRAYYASSATGGEMPRPDGALVGALVVIYGGMSLVSLVMWHAPALVHWGGQGAAQSLFSSALAVWRTRGAFTVYVLGWTLLGSVLMVLTNVLALLGLGAVALFVLMPMLVMGFAVFYVSLYFTFTGTFQLED